MAGACDRARDRDGRERSILLVTLDTTRADRLGCYGRLNAGTPVLDALAARGARFERAYTTAPITLPAHASILTGSTPPHHGLRDNGINALGAEVETLAESCARAGRRTAACVSGFPVSRLFGLDQGFEHYDDRLEEERAVPGAFLERRADATVARAREWLATLASGESFFLWVHLFDPHEPHAAPPEFARRFPDDPYQAEIAFVDHALGALLGELERLARTADTLVVVTADHGESLGEHGETTHGLQLYDATMRVPLLFAGPGVVARALSAPVSLVDLAATLVELAEIDDGGEFSRHSGRSLAALLRGEAGLEPERSAYLETYYPRLHYGWSELVGITRGDWKYVEAPGALGPDGRVSSELYRPLPDPGELLDLAQHEPEHLLELARELGAQRRSLEANAVPWQPHEPSEEEAQALAALGYSGADVTAELPGASALSPPAPDPRRVIGCVPLFEAVHMQSASGAFEDAARSLQRLEALAPGAVLLHEALQR
ncbi:MAG: sulfatase, partial [Planctomycetes bacterium]|nr:sulfatase [Planctomycetota bacterium]